MIMILYTHSIYSQIVLDTFSGMIFTMTTCSLQTHLNLNKPPSLSKVSVHLLTNTPLHIYLNKAEYIL